jgi:peroxiredoxin
MKFKATIFPVIALFAISSFAMAQKTLPEVTIKTLTGQPVNIKDHASNEKITVLSFWATWCSPCKKELDAIMDYYPEWEEDLGVEIVAISIDDTRGLTKVKPMVEQKGWEYIIYSDINQELRQSLNFQAIPQTFVIDKKGDIVYSHSGYVPGDEVELDEFLRELAEKQ